MLWGLDLVRIASGIFLNMFKSYFLSLKLLQELPDWSVVSPGARCSGEYLLSRLLATCGFVLFNSPFAC